MDFVFEPNEYFTNKVLSKTYYLKVEVQDDSPADFDGIEFEKCEGTIIDWNEGKNPMITVIKKKQKHKTRGIVRTMSKTMARSSFFSFFKPPQGLLFFEKICFNQGQNRLFGILRHNYFNQFDNT